MISWNLVLFLVLGTDAAVPAIEDLEKTVVAQRRAIVRGSATLKSKLETFGARPVQVTQTVRLWFDGRKIRTDQWQSGAGSVAGSRMVDCRNCEKDGYFVAWDEEEIQGVKVALLFDRISPESERSQAKMLDLRMVGMAPTHLSNLINYKLESFLLRPDREAPTINREVYKGAECWVIRYTDLRGSRVSIWICPVKENGIVRMVSEDKDRATGKWNVSSIDCELARASGAGFWFPSRCVYTLVFDGKLQRKEVLDLSDVTLNEPIPAEVFTIAGIDVRDGTPIASADYVPNDRGNWYWKDSAIVQLADPPRVPGGLVGASGRWRRWAAVGAIAAALMAGGFVMFHLVRRRLR